MIPRILEPEVMDTAEEAQDYDSMDHRAVNRLFVDDFLAQVESGPLGSRFRDAAEPPHVLDLGTGTAQIPIELCRRSPAPRVTAVDLAAKMLVLARQNVARAGLEHRISLTRSDAKQLPDADHAFEAAISNSIVHHIPDPTFVFSEMRRVIKPGGVLFVRDLLRPDDHDTLEQLVHEYAGDATPRQQSLFRASLAAALTLPEIRRVLACVGLPENWAVQTSDRHWTVAGHVAGTR